MNENSKLLVNTIVTYWQTGIRISKSIHRFIDATFGNPTPAQIAAMLTDTDNEERELLLEAVVFPEETFLVDIEPQLAAGCFTAQDEISIIEQLWSIGPTAVVFTTLQDDAVLVALPEGTVERFVERLRITWQIPPETVAAIAECFPAEKIASVRVPLRHAGVPATYSARTFLNRFFETIRHDESCFSDCYTFVIKFLNELGDDQAVLPALLGKRKNLAQHLRSAARFAERLQRSNIETLMLQGERPPSIHPAETRETLNMIDILLKRMFVGIDTSAGGADNERDLGDHHGIVGMGAVIRLLNE